MHIALFVAALAALAYAWMLAPAAMPEPPLSGARAYAHRGLYDNAGPAPENSLKAFKAAIARGYAIELDVRLTKDGRVVAFHDDTLSRMCGLRGRVDGFTLPQLKELSLLGGKERIPEFGEALAAIGGKVPLLIEFKTGLPGTGQAAERLCEAAMPLLDGYRGPFAIESLDYLVLSWYRRHRPEVPRGQLAMGMLRYEPALGKDGARAIPWHRRAMMSSLLYNFSGRPHFVSYRHEDAGLCVAVCRTLGAAVAVWTATTPEEGDRLLARYDSVIFEGYLA